MYTRSLSSCRVNRELLVNQQLLFDESKYGILFLVLHKDNDVVYVVVRVPWGFVKGVAIMHCILLFYNVLSYFHVVLLNLYNV